MLCEVPFKQKLKERVWVIQIKSRVHGAPKDSMCKGPEANAKWGGHGKTEFISSEDVGRGQLLQDLCAV